MQETREGGVVLFIEGTRRTERARTRTDVCTDVFVKSEKVIILRASSHAILIIQRAMCPAYYNLYNIF